MLWVVVLLFFAASGLIWWMFRRQLAHRQNLLQESTELYQFAFRTSPDAVSITRLSDGCYLDINDGFTRLFGWSRQEVVGQTSLQLAIWHNLNDRTSFMERFRSSGHCENFETIFVAKDGRSLPVIVFANAITLNGEQYGLEYFRTSSNGVAMFGDHEARPSEPLNRAELAIHQDKSAGRNTWNLYNPQMQFKESARTTLEVSLRDALHSDQFMLHYQAQINEFGVVVGLESLIRWKSPERGMVSPSEFIPLAEETGLILPLGLWALEKVCQQLVEWRSKPDRSHLTIAVNVSASQFNQVDFVPMVMDVIHRSGVNPHSLKLELTESVLINQIDNVIEKMKLLKAIGVKFSLDDFGTGFSSLSYLKRMPLDQLKIDQSFVRDILVDPNDGAIAKTVIDLGKSLGFSVIAEGVETEAQRNALYAMGCVLYQGYLFSQPLPIDELESYLSSLPVS